MEQTLLKEIERHLGDGGVVFETSTVCKHAHQGFMSEVFVADTNKGTVLIQVVGLVPEHKRNKVWYKFQALRELLPTRKNIPAPRFLFCDCIGDGFVIVQSFLEGERSGQRTLQGLDVIDEWTSERTDTIKKVLTVLAEVHALEFTRFGWEGVSNRSDGHTYASWREFLEQDSSVWVQDILACDHVIPEETLLRVVDQAVTAATYTGPPVLVHGDAINPSNVLVNDGQIALLDWEWSIAADPAWEFCDLGWKRYRTKEGLEPYFRARGMGAEDQDTFLERVHAYARAWLLWGAYMHVRDADKAIYNALVATLLKEVS